MRPVWYMTDAELISQARALTRAADREALTNPVTLARHLDPRYRLRPHLRAIGEALGSLRPGSGDRLLIVTPPQIGKSVAISVWMPFWWLVLNPEHRVVIGSYGNALATTRGRSIRKLVNEYGQRYDIALERGSQSAHEWALTSGGGVKSVGVGSGVTGFPADLAVVDDPHKSRAEADSLIVRNKVWEWWSGDLTSRMAPGAPVCLVQTRWHVDDLAGRLLKDQGRIEEGGRWRVLHLPALAVEHDPLGREVGAPLSHPKIPARDTAALAAHWAEKRRSSTVRDWHALYQGDPQPTEGALISADVLRDRRYTVAPASPVMHAVAVDPSGGGRDSCGIIGGFRGDDGRVYWTHDRSGVMPTEQWARVACELAHALRAEKIIIEANFGGDQAALIIRTAWTALAAEQGLPDIPPRIELVHARKGKRLRAEPVAQLIIEDRTRLVGFMPDLEAEWVGWQPTDTDSPGRIDASTYLTLALIGSVPSSVGTPGDTQGLPNLPTLPNAPTPTSGGLPTLPGATGAPGGLPTLPTMPGMPGRGY